MEVPLCGKCSKYLAIGSSGLCNFCNTKPLSEIIREDAQQEDNDLAYLGKMIKSMREARLERFEDGYKELLEKNNCIVIPFNGSKVVIDTQTDKFGIIDYFPKANKLLIRKKNKWETQGLKWINQNLISTNLK